MLDDDDGDKNDIDDDNDDDGSDSYDVCTVEVQTSASVQFLYPTTTRLTYLHQWLHSVL